jgi:probable addiction module antidote protein
MKPSVSFDETSRQLLNDPETAAMYLEEFLEDENLEQFKLALRHVAEARLGSMTALSEATHLNRELLNRALSGKSNPRLDTRATILNALGLRIGVTTAKELSKE